MKASLMVGEPVDPFREASGVAALTLLDMEHSKFPSGAADANVLTVVRRPETNETHPNTLSVPTQRIPPSLLAALTEKRRQSSSLDDLSFVSSRTQSGHDEVVYVVESLLSRKLGLAEELEAGKVEFEAAVGLLLTDEVNYPEDTSSLSSELIAMVNIVVLLERGAEVIPDVTSAYSAIQWAPWRNMPAAFSTKDTARLIPSLDPVDICIHGLCVASTVHLWERVASVKSS